MIRKLRITMWFTLILSTHLTLNACKVGHGECSITHGTEGDVELCIHSLYEDYGQIDDSTLWYLEEDGTIDLDPELYEILKQQKEHNHG